MEGQRTIFEILEEITKLSENLVVQCKDLRASTGDFTKIIKDANEQENSNNRPER